MSKKRPVLIGKLTLLGLLLITYTASGQIQTTITNVRVKREGLIYRVTYDLTAIHKLDSIYLSAESLRKGALPVRSVQGNVGLGQTVGTNKTITWSVANDADIEGDSVMLAVDAAPSIRAKRIGGSWPNALVSAVLPGVGNIFVQPRRKVGLRPAVTAVYAGLLIYGLSQRAESNKQYDIYKRTLKKELAQPSYEAANAANQRYLVAVRGAALVWAVDVTATFLRGLRNDAQRRRLSSDLSWHPLLKTPLFGLRYRW